MNGTQLMAHLCKMEAYIHLIKANNLLDNKEQELLMLKALRTCVDDIFNACVSENETRICLAK